MDRPSPILIILWLLFAGKANVFARPYFSMDEATRSAYRNALSLRFGDAAAQLATLKRASPDNLMADYVENYMDVLRVYLNEDKQEYQRLYKNRAARLARIEQADAQSPFYLFTQAEIRLQWALVNAKFGENWTAAMEVRAAFKLLEKNQRLFPKFIANKKSLGVLHTLVGTIPDNYKWGAKLVGMSGTVQGGLRELEGVLDYAKKNDFVFEEETLVMYALLLLHVGNASERAWNALQSPRIRPDENPLACYAQANVAINTGKNDLAIRLLENCPKGNAYYPFHVLDMLLGEAKLARLDDDADTYLLRYVNQYKGKSYIKECYQHLAWHSLVLGDMKGYRAYMQLCKTKGGTDLESDKKAQRDAESGAAPNVELLKARLLFDGGYFQRALDVLTRQSPNGLSDADRLERTYRLARVQHELGDLPEAKAHYQETIDFGRSSPFYYACKSALELGKIYEGEKDKARATAYYNLCLSMRPEEYRNSLHQQAKAGLSRLK
jgi:hypothetical protein